MLYDPDVARYLQCITGKPPVSVSQLGETCSCLPPRYCLSYVETEQQPVKLINQFSHAESFSRGQ